VFGHPEKQLKNIDLARVRKLVTRRSQHEPVALIIGEKEFWSLPFKVTTATLIPRPDSETLIEAVLSRHPDKKLPTRILDLGTGSGCLLLALLHEYENSTGTGLDLSEDALKVARFNGENLGLERRADFIQTNWNNEVPSLADFDIIISNPPYVAENDRGTLLADVVDYEPDRALFAGQDGLREYKTIISLLAESTNVTGNVFFEVGINQADVVAKMLKKAGLVDILIHLDIAGIGRCVAAKM
jgi:release factor glutamine methyltransferase